MACSGHAATHSPQPWHWSARTANAWRFPCAQAFSRPTSESERLSSADSGRISNTEYGHTRTQSSLASQRLRSTTGAITPGGCLHGSAPGFATGYHPPMSRITRIAVRDIEMEVEEAGQGGRGFVLVHGFTGSRDDFREQMAPLAEHGRTLALDQRGHGGTTNSGKHEPYTLAGLAADLLGAFDALGLERADLLGHSLGGAVVLRFALAHPERVASLVLMDTSPRPIKMRFSESARAAIAAFAREHGMKALAARTRAMMATSDAVPPSARRLEQSMGADVFWQRIERKHEQMDPVAWDALSAEMGKVESVVERLGEIRCPTTVLVGAEDLPFLKPSDEMEQGIPGARRVTIPDAAHSPQLENPAAWLAAIRAHLDRARATA